MTWLEDIGTYLQTNGIGTVASDIFYNGFDLKAANCIALFNQPGMQSRITLKKTMTLKKPELGVRVKYQDDATADQKAEAIENLLDGVNNQTIGSTRFKSIRAIAPHFFVSQDETDGFIYSINFEIRIG